jgi:hypothetical protein
MYLFCSNLSPTSLLINNYHISINICAQPLSIVRRVAGKFRIERLINRGDPRSVHAWVPALRRTAEVALHRVRDTMPYFPTNRPEAIRGRWATGQL